MSRTRVTTRNYKSRETFAQHVRANFMRDVNWSTVREQRIMRAQRFGFTVRDDGCVVSRTGIVIGRVDD